jgi:archaellum component FlaC
MLLSSMTCSHGLSGQPISYFCRSGCWEAKGKSSKFIEHYMKGIHAVGRFDDCMPYDVPDFERCVDILNIHPEWVPRLPEMKRLKCHGSGDWKRLIGHWDMFMALFNELPHIKKPNVSHTNYSDRERQQYEYFNYLLQGITHGHGLLKKYKLRCNHELFNFRLKEHLVVGSHVLQEKNQDDEFDLYPSILMDNFPTVSCGYFDTKGKQSGWKTARSYLPKFSPQEEVLNDESLPLAPKITDIEAKIVDIMQSEISNITQSEIQVDEPIEQVNEPIEQVDEPIEQVNEPIEQVDEPIEQVNEPIEQVDEPIEQVDEPIEQVNKTVEQVNETVESVIEPVIETIEPKKEHKCTISFPRKPVVDTLELRKNELSKKLLNQMEEYVKQNPDIWLSTNFHYCPHYVLYANDESLENEVSFDMFTVDVYPLDEDCTNDNWKLGMCIVSISTAHQLHPKNKSTDNESLDIIFNGEKWVISSDPVRMYTFYEDGLINCGSEEFYPPTTISDEEITNIIEENIKENAKLEQRENEINNNQNKTPLQSIGIISISCG